MAQFYGGYTGIPGAPGNPAGMQGTIAGNPFGSDFVIQQKRNVSPAGGPQLGPLPQSPARLFPKDQPGREGAIDVRFRQAFGMPGVPGAPGNLGPFASEIPQGPHTPLPVPGWNPGMIKPPGNPNYRPSPLMEKIGPLGQPVPWNAAFPAGFHNKFVS